MKNLLIVLTTIYATIAGIGLAILKVTDMVMNWLAHDAGIEDIAELYDDKKTKKAVMIEAIKAVLMWPYYVVIAIKSIKVKDVKEFMAKEDVKESARQAFSKKDKKTEDTEEASEETEFETENELG